MDGEILMFETNPDTQEDSSLRKNKTLKFEPINEDLNCIYEFGNKSSQSLIRLINSQRSVRYRTPLQEKPTHFESAD